MTLGTTHRDAFCIIFFLHIFIVLFLGLQQQKLTPQNKNKSGLFSFAKSNFKLNLISIEEDMILNPSAAAAAVVMHDRTNVLQ